MRILILNWRDIRSPRAGGAEFLTHEVAKRLAGEHEVTWFASRPDGMPETEEIDGVRIVRRGSEATTRLYVPGFAREDTWDVIVEEINTLPYFAPLWSSVPVVLFIPQLARGVWWYEAPKVIAPIGYATEPLYLRAYRNIMAVTISASTRDDLRRLGHQGEIHVLPVGVTTSPLTKLPPKTPVGQLISIGRLVPSKRMDHAIRTVTKLHGVAQQASLTIVGDGPELGRLRQLIKRLGAEKFVHLAGKVSHNRKNELIAEADFLIACSVREGWGLTVTEAARLGTPAMVYDVAGLRDSVISERTGLRTAPSPSALAAAIQRALREEGLYDRLRSGAWREASKLDWEGTSIGFHRALTAATRDA